MTNQKQKKKKKNYVPSRLNLLFFAVFLLFSALILRLGFVQIVFGEDYRKEVDRTENVTVNTLAPRGKILDRYQNVVVDNTPLNAITYTRMQSTTPQEMLDVAEKLSKIIEMKPKKVQERDRKDYWILTRPEEAAKLITDEDRKKVEDGELEEKDLYDLQLDRISKSQLDEITKAEEEILAIFREFNKGYALTPQIVKNEEVTAQEFAMVSENLADLPGVDITTDFVRDYVYGNTLNSVFGKVSTSETGIPSERIKEFLARGYSRNDRVGTSQLEAQYENVLQGQKARVRNITDTAGNLLHQEKVFDGKRGNDLVLSVDMELQQEIEEIVTRELLQTKPGREAKYLDRAFVVVMNPKTGEVLSLAGKQIERNENGQYEVYDHALGAIQEAYEPGSTVKGATVLAGLEHGVISPGQYLYDTPIYLGTSKDTRPKGSYVNMGNINDWTALERSSNVYMFRIAMAIAGANYSPRQPIYFAPSAYEQLRNYYAQFGLGVETGIDLPRESAGVEGIEFGLPGLLLDLSIGQYDTYTTLQLAQYVSTIANGGYRMKPQLVREIREPSNDVDTGQLVRPFRPEVLNRVDMSDSHIKRVQDGFIRVYHGARGTASSSKAKEFKPAGKSGTAESPIFEVTGKRPDGSNIINEIQTLNFNLVGYAPYDNPEMAFAIMVPKASTDFSVTGGIATRIGDAVMEAYFGLKEERAKGKPKLEEQQQQETEDAEEDNEEDTE